MEFHTMHTSQFVKQVPTVYRVVVFPLGSVIFGGML